MSATTGVVTGMVGSVDDPRDKVISGLPERIERAAELAKKSANALSVEIGGGRTQLNMTCRRLRENPSTGVDVRIVANLARVTGVSLDWLVMGKGSAVASPEEKARQAARALG